MDPLLMPLGAISRQIEPIAIEDSIDRAATLMREVGMGVIPVVDNGVFVGIINESSLMRVLSEGRELTDSVASIMESCKTLPASATGAEALRSFGEDDGKPVVVLETSGYPIGVVAASDLFHRRFHAPVPAVVGGMATPFGVYLTNGTVSGGASQWALVATGSLLFVILLCAQILTTTITPVIPDIPWKIELLNVLPIVLFLLTMRLIPLSGIHAAEHKVVHALERGELLTVEVVDRMPRVHPRCGTNIAVGSSIFLTIFTFELIPNQELRFLLGAIVALVFWKPLGSMVQSFITTRPPSKRQVESGIAAAKDLLNNYQTNRRVQAHPVQRILKSGMLHVMLGSFLTFAVAYGIGQIFHLPILY